jgi:glutamyl-tRNA reductase
VEQIRQSELERLGGKLGDLTDEQRAQVEMITTSIVNKILHMPTVKMKEVAGSDECYLYVDAVRTLFDLSRNGDAPAGGAENGSGDGAALDAGAAVHKLRGTGTEDA